MTKNSADYVHNLCSHQSRHVHIAQLTYKERKKTGNTGTTTGTWQHSHVYLNGQRIQCNACLVMPCNVHVTLTMLYASFYIWSATTECHIIWHEQLVVHGVHALLAWVVAHTAWLVSWTCNVMENSAITATNRTCTCSCTLLGLWTLVCRHQHIFIPRGNSLQGSRHREWQELCIDQDTCHPGVIKYHPACNLCKCMTAVSTRGFPLQGEYPLKSVVQVPINLQPTVAWPAHYHEYRWWHAVSAAVSTNCQNQLTWASRIWTRYAHSWTSSITAASVCNLAWPGSAHRARPGPGWCNTGHLFHTAPPTADCMRSGSVLEVHPSA